MYDVESIGEECVWAIVMIFWGCEGFRWSAYHVYFNKPFYIFC